MKNLYIDNDDFNTEIRDEKEFNQALQFIFMSIDTNLLTKLNITRVYYSYCPFEQALIKLFSRLDFQTAKMLYMEADAETIVSYRHNGGVRKYVVNAFDHSDPALSRSVVTLLPEGHLCVLIKQRITPNCVFKTEETAVIEKLREIEKKQSDNNQISFVYWKREFTNRAVVRQIGEAIRQCKKDKDPVFVRCAWLEKDMSVLCVTGVEESYSLNTEFAAFQQADMKMVLLTEDCLRNSLNIARAIKFQADIKSRVTFDFHDAEAGRAVFNDVFFKFGKIMKKEFLKNSELQHEEFINMMANQSKLFQYQRLFFVVSAAAFTTICSDSYLFFHFKFLLRYCAFVVGYQFDSAAKKIFVELLSEIDREKTTVVLSKSRNDFEMLDSGGVGVQVLDENNSSVNTEIALADVQKLSELTFGAARNLYLGALNLILFTVFIFLLNCWVFVFDNLMVQKRSYQQIVPTRFIMLTNYVFVCLGGGALAFFKEPAGDKAQLPQTIQEHHLVPVNRQFKILLSTGVETFVCVSVLYVGLWSFYSRLPHEGLLLSVDGLLCVTLLTLPHVYSFKLVLLASNKLLVALFCALSLAVSGLGLFIVVTQLNLPAFSSQNFAELAFFFPLTLVVFLLVVFFLLLLQVTLHLYSVQFYYEPLNLAAVFAAPTRGREYLLNILKVWYEHYKNNSFFKDSIQTFPTHVAIDPQLNATIAPQEDAKQSFTLHSLTLAINNADLNLQYEFKSKQDLLYALIFFLAYLPFVVLLIYIEVLTGDVKRENIHFNIYLCSVLIPAALATQLLSNQFVKIKFLKLIVWYMPLLLNFNLINNEFSLLFNAFVIVVANTTFGFNFLTILLLNGFDLGLYALILAFNNAGTENLGCVASFFSLSLAAVAVLRWKYYQEKLVRNNIIIINRLHSRLNYNTELLTFLMPRFVLERISYDLSGNTVSDFAGEVTVLFADICGFDALIDQFDKEIVTLLDKIFRDFDILCEKHGVQKIETVGKTYLAACGIIWVESKLPPKIQAINPSLRVMNLAIHMNKMVKQHLDKRGLPIQIKIGVHRGPAMMGVIGYHKP